jgi:RNA polymerase sigma-70 factor (ECF subfamily)
VPLALEELEFCVSAGDDVEEAVAARLLGERINTFLESLPRRERDLFLCRYYDLEDLETLAAAKGLSKAHAAVLLFRTRKKLKAFLEKEELL